MTSFGTVKLKDVWAMLDHCAAGYSKTKTTHNWRVQANGKCYPSLPLGPHGKRENPAIEKGHIKQMARALGILACAKTQLAL